MALPYAAEFNRVEFSRLRDGIVPEVMEDKWFVYFEEPYLYLHRSWTGHPVYRLRLEATSDGARVAEALWSSDLAARPSSDIEYEAKLLDFLLSNLLLDQAKPFPRPARVTEPVPGLLQHHVSGTGYREAQHGEVSSSAPPAQGKQKAKRPWWRMW